MAESFLRMTRKWLEGAAGLRLETVTQSFTKRTGERADELISGSVSTERCRQQNKNNLLEILLHINDNHEK
ncbi:MAG: hypothetical protein IJ257_03005, partial [Treponema sp.]|nr:hypothetical protein [Treponema sp.]